MVGVQLERKLDPITSKQEFTGKLTKPALMVLITHFSLPSKIIWICVKYLHHSLINLFIPINLAIYQHTVNT